MSNQKPIAENLFTWPSDQPKLLGSKDTETGRYFFPAKKSNTHEQVSFQEKENYGRGLFRDLCLKHRILVQKILKTLNHML